jgi:type I pantothenate kinase
VEREVEGVRDDPQLVALAEELAESAHQEASRAAAAAGAGPVVRRPFVVGLVGSVAVGKSTTARALAELLGEEGHGFTTEVVATDSFLLTNDQLEPLGGVMVKGQPLSYDWTAMERFLADVAHGSPVLSVRWYSHDAFDVVRGVQHVMSMPDVLILEGLNLLQGPPAAPIDVADHLDRSIYLDAPVGVIRDWFVTRFLDATSDVAETPGSFYAGFAGMDREELEAIARWTWDEINEPNLRDHIEPTRVRADIVVHKAADHSIDRIELRTRP